MADGPQLRPCSEPRHDPHRGPFGALLGALLVAVWLRWAKTELAWPLAAVYFPFRAPLRLNWPGLQRQSR